MKAHAKLSASGATRWMTCPKSVDLEEMFPDPGSEYAAEGTKAHEVAEVLLKALLGVIDSADAEERMNALAPDTEMYYCGKGYAEYCHDLLKQEQLEYPQAYFTIEETMSYDNIVPEGFGTADFSVISLKRMITVDYKYGKGVPVSAQDNPQLRLYGVAGLNEYDWIYPIEEEVQMHIYQPRLNAISVEILTVAELREWAKSIIPLAKRAYNNKGKYNPGTHCRFCRARAVCRARAKYALNTITNLISGGKE